MELAYACFCAAFNFLGSGARSRSPRLGGKHGQELPGKNHTDILESSGEMSHVPRNHVVRPRFKRALQKFVAFGIHAYLYLSPGFHEHGRSSQSFHRSESGALIEPQVRSFQHLAILVENWSRHITAKSRNAAKFRIDAMGPRDSIGPTQRHSCREPLESSVSLFLSLAAIALYCPVYVSQCQLIEGFGFGFTANRFKFTNWLIKQPQVLLERI
jgi:hypothetical protein